MWGRVPFFFFLGGYFAARSLGKNPGDTAQFLKRRFIALLPPYLFWNLVSVSLMAAALVAGFQLVETDHLDLTTILMRITGFGLHPADASLWFIRDFLICICFAPLLMRLGVWSLIPCMVLAIIPEIPDDLFKHGFPRLSSLGYFGIGMLLALAPRGITAKLFPRPGRACIMILCVGLVYAICDFPKPGLAGVILGALGILLTGQFIDQSIPKLAAWMGKHASASFIIFAANAPLLAVAKQAYIRYQFGIPLALYFTVLTIAFFFLSIAFHSLVKRYLPGLLMLVSGGR